MSCSRVNKEECRIPLDEITRDTKGFSAKPLGSGGFGHVYLGQLSEQWKNRKVAIKRYDPKGRQGEKEFYSEVKLASSFHNPNIIQYIGYCDDANEKIIVYEYASNGSLDYHLYSANKKRCLTWAQRLKICLGVAKGLKYLHSGDHDEDHKRVIHRDVKSGNILLDDNLEAKICDFGLSRLGPTNQPDDQVITHACGTNCYIDPNYVERGRVSKESDIYSFGVVMFEMSIGMLAHQERCFEDGQKHNLIDIVRSSYEDHKLGLDKLVDPDIRDDIDTTSFDIFNEIAHECINLDLKKRPTIDRIINRIEAALNIQENVVSLMKGITKEVGISNGKPVAAFTIYEFLVPWRFLQAERTNLFNRLIQTFDSVVQDEDRMTYYWLSSACTLLSLLEERLKPYDATSISKQPPPISIIGKMRSALHSSSSHEDENKADGRLRIFQPVEAKDPALFFMQQLTKYREKVYGIIRENLKRELDLLLGLYIQVPPTSEGELTFGQSFSNDSQFNSWQLFVDCLNTYLNSMKNNYVPPTVVQKMFSQSFAYISTELYNSLRWRTRSSTFNKYVKDGLAYLDIWCDFATEEVNSGQETLFWFDNWTGGGNVAAAFLTLFELYRKKSCFVSERMGSEGFKGAWKKIPSSQADISHLTSLKSRVDPFCISDGADRWRSLLSSDGKFYVRDLRGLIDSKITTSAENPTVWVNTVPLKVVCFVWRACLDRIPSAMALARRRIGNSGVACPRCSNGSEDANHILLGCPVAKDLLSIILRWCGIAAHNFMDVKDLISFVAKWGDCPKRRKVLLTIIYGYFWCIWRAHNDKVFNKIDTSTTKLADNITSLTFGWMKNRGSYGNERRNQG